MCIHSQIASRGAQWRDMPWGPLSLLPNPSLNAISTILIQPICRRIKKTFPQIDHTWRTSYLTDYHLPSVSNLRQTTIEVIRRGGLIRVPCCHTSLDTWQWHSSLALNSLLMFICYLLCRVFFFFTI